METQNQHTQTQAGTPQAPYAGPGVFDGPAPMLFGAVAETMPRQAYASLDLTQLIDHPDRPGQLSQARFRKLKRLIEKDGHYEPIVVRVHPDGHHYQILNGHQRARALRELGRRRADCVIFNVSDYQAAMYMATLNRLGGKDDLGKRARLVEQLRTCRSSQVLARYLPESRHAIEKLLALARKEAMPVLPRSRPELIPITFFADDSQESVLNEAIDKAVGKDELGTRTEKRMRAICRMAKYYLGKDVF